MQEFDEKFTKKHCIPKKIYDNVRQNSGIDSRGKKAYYGLAEIKTRSGW